MRILTPVLTLGLAAALAACGDVPTIPYSRLSAVGFSLYNQDEQAVTLQTVSLEGLFDAEPGVTRMDGDLHWRLHRAAANLGLETAVDEAMALNPPDDPTLACPVAGQAGWTEAVLANLAGVDETGRTALRNAVAEQPPLCGKGEGAVRSLLEERFGAVARNKALNRFRRGWIVEADLAWIRQQGFSGVRVPLAWDSLLLSSALVEPGDLAWDPDALAILDNLVDACHYLRLYVVLALVSAPGGPGGVYDNTDLADLTAQWWSVLAKRYAGREGMAAYELLASATPGSAQARDELYDHLVATVRAQDQKVICVVEDGGLGVDTLPTPGRRGWTNIAFAFRPDRAALPGMPGSVATLGGQVLPPVMTAAATSSMPAFLNGLSLTRRDEDAYADMAGATLLLNENGVSWCLASYKVPDDHLAASLWEIQTGQGVRHRLEGAPSWPDLYNDSLETLLTAMDAYRELAVWPDPALLAALRFPLPSDETDDNR